MPSESAGSPDNRPLILALDQGTTSTRAMIFDPDGRPLARAARPLPQSYPRPGRVEYDPDRILEDARTVCREVLREAEVEPDRIRALGITNQRETTLLWDRGSGRAVGPAIGWQDRRTEPLCRRLREEGAEALVRERTGLLLDPYFSATKLAWMLDRDGELRREARSGRLAFGTVDSWLLWGLTGGRVHATDATNASRTLLYDIHEGRWDGELLELFGVPGELLPEVRDSAHLYGETEEGLLGRPVPIAGVAGDQQAAAFGQAVFRPGMVKATYGTGGFLLLNTGEAPVPSEHRLLTTLAWRLKGQVAYALEGSIFSAGSAVQWLQEGLGLLEDPAESGEMAASLEDAGGVHLVPAFTGLGAPHWDPDARGALLGLTRDTGPAHLARAALEAVAFQTRDLMEAMASDYPGRTRTLRVDGGLSRSDWTMGFLADLLELPVERPAVTETTALGAASLAGLATGLHGDLDELEARWRADRRWEPTMEEARRRELVEGWRGAVRRVLSPPLPPEPGEREDCPGST